MLEIKVSVDDMLFEMFRVQWTRFNTTNIDHRYFTGYLLYYKVVDKPGTVDDIYADRDACFDT